MVLVRSLLVSAFAFPLALSNPVVVERALDCSRPKVQSFVNYAQSVASRIINPFCSSYLHYTPAKTSTVTETYTTEELAIEYFTDPELTITYFAEEVTVSDSTTVTVSRTIELYANVRRRDAAPEPAPAAFAAPAPAPATTTKPPTPASPAQLLLYGASLVSQGCSCLVPSPTPTTETSYIPVTVFVTYIETIAAHSTTTTETFTAMSYSYFSIRSTKTLANPTSCGPSASPSAFFVQMRDANRSNTDQWDNNYLARVGGEFRQSFYNDEYIKPDWKAIPEGSKQRGVLLTIEPGTGYLKTVVDNHYMNSDPYNDFQLFYFNNKTWIDTVGHHYHQCKIVAAGKDRELVCTVPQSYWKLSFYQTCPLYQEYYQTPFVVGAEVSLTSPDCQHKRFYVVDACK